MNPNSNISQELFETIERYLNKTMDRHEYQEFEVKLNTNQELKAQVNEMKTMLLGIETQSLKDKLHEFHNQLDDESNNKPVIVKTLHFRKIAVAAILIIALGGFWFFSGNTNEKLYGKYFIPDPGLPTMMSETSNFKLYDAMVNYKQGEYNIAIKKWHQLLNNNSRNDTLNYFIGVAELANKNEKNAIEYLEFVTNSEVSVFKNDAYYYLGLAYLKAGNIEFAKKNLTFSTVDNSKKILLELND